MKQSTDNEPPKELNRKDCFVMRSLLRQWYGRDYSAREITAYQRKAISVSDMVEKVASRALSPGMVLFSRICNEWAELVGQQIAMYVIPVALQNGCLLIEVRHNAWLRELHGQTGEMIKDKLISTYGNEIYEIKYVPAGRRRR
jgi:predicted nucleic acid-binding Zn ribbon protein